jgi:hypothetical protein
MQPMLPWNRSSRRVSRLSLVSAASRFYNVSTSGPPTLLDSADRKYYGERNDFSSPTTSWLLKNLDKHEHSVPESLKRTGADDASGAVLADRDATQSTKETAAVPPVLEDMRTENVERRSVDEATVADKNRRRV